MRKQIALLAAAACTRLLCKDNNSQRRRSCFVKNDIGSRYGG